MMEPSTSSLPPTTLSGASPFATLPKVELHCHLVGVISPALLGEIRRKGGEVLVDPDALRLLQPIAGLDSFKNWVAALKPYHTAPPHLMRPILETHVANLRAQGVVYTEIMISPAMFSTARKPLVESLYEWREWAFGLERGEVQIEFVMVVPRSLAPEMLARDTTDFLELGRKGLIVGVALVGPECGESIERFKRSFDRWRDGGLGIEVHAGEHSGTESVWDAIRHADPKRLGHALSAFADPELLEHVGANHIHLEFCPTSNLRTGAVSSLKQCPIDRARDLGISFSVNTDDPGGFDCSLISEYQLVADTFNFKQNDFEAMYRNSLAARFASTLRHLSPS